VSVVYVIQEAPGRNIVAAHKFGRLVTLLAADVQLQGDVSPDLIDALSTRLRDYSDEDAILAMGDPALIGIVCAIAARQNDGVFALLKWDREEQTYYPVRVDVGLIDDFDLDVASKRIVALEAQLAQARSATPTSETTPKRARRKAS